MCCSLHYNNCWQKFWDTPHWWVLFHCSPAWLEASSWLPLVDREDSSYLPSGWCEQQPNSSSFCQSGAAQPVRWEGPGFVGVFFTGVAQKHIPIRTYLSAALVFSGSSKGPCWGKINGSIFTAQILNIGPGCQHLVWIIFQSPLCEVCYVQMLVNKCGIAVRVWKCSVCALEAVMTENRRSGVLRS